MEPNFPAFMGAQHFGLMRAKMKRHDSEEISRLLRQAEEMMKGGMSQKDVCRSLGISVMTFHRWRKQLPAFEAAHPPEQLAEGAELGRAESLEALKLENHRLRRIVSDLLLEKMKVQEALEKTKK